MSMKMNSCWRNLPPGPKPPSKIYAIIEVPKGSNNKYEFDCETGFFKLDRVLYSPIHFPTDYGLIPSTWSLDGDPLDILVFTTSSTFTGCIIVVRPIGMLITEDEAGEDEKIIGVPVKDPRFDQVTELNHLSPHTLVEIEDFFINYKKLEPGKFVKVKGWKGIKEAERMIISTIQLFKEKFT